MFLLLMVAALLLAWSHPAAAQNTGALMVHIEGLPGGASAAVDVAGPDGYSRSVTGASGLTGLAPGAYTVSAAETRYGCTAYTPGAPSAVVTVTAGATAEVTVRHTDTWTGPWQTGAAEEDYGTAVGLDADCNLYVAGFTEGGLDGHANPDGVHTEVYVTKYDVHGDRLWSKVLDSGDDDEVYDLSVAPDGGIVLVGEAVGDLDGNASTLRQNYVLKLNAGGEVLWIDQVHGGTSPRAVVVDGAGSVYVAGFGTGTTDGQPSLGSSDAFLTKYSVDGAWQWTQVLGTDQADVVTDAALDAAGNLYVTGHTRGSLAGTNQGGQDVIVAKYDGAGSRQWVQQVGTARDDRGYGVAADDAGNVYVAGQVGAAFAGNAGLGNADAVLMRFDAAGTRQWARQFGTGATDAGVAVAYGAGRLYVLASTPRALAGDALGRQDLVLVPFTTDGTEQPGVQFGTAADDQSGIAVDEASGALVLDAVGTAFVAGYTEGAFEGQANAGKEDLFLTRIQFFTPGTATPTEAAAELPTSARLAQNYPNPFNPQTAIRFELAAPQRVRLAVFDVLGRRVAVLVEGHLAAGTHEVAFEARDLQSGTYLYRLETEAGVQVRKMTVVR